MSNVHFTDPPAPAPAQCSAPALPPDSTIGNRRLTYKAGDHLNVTCNHGPDWFELDCVDGTWNGENIVCPEPVIGIVRHTNELYSSIIMAYDSIAFPCFSTHALPFLEPQTRYYL